MLKYLLALCAIIAGAAIPAVSHADTVKGPFSFTKSSFDFYYSIGGELPTLQSLEFQNITGSGVTYALSIPDQPAWLNGTYNTTASTLGPNIPSGLGAAVNVEGLAAGNYYTNIYLSGSFTGSPVLIPINLHILPSGTPLPSHAVHPEGSNVKTADGTVYRISSGTRTPYTSAGAFLSYGFNRWEDVKEANSADLALLTGSCSYADGSGSHPCYIQPRDGSLINDHGTIYIITDGYRAGFASAEAFLGFGYSFSHALEGDTSFLSTLAPINTHKTSHPSGTVVNASGTICVIVSPFREGGIVGRRCFSTLADMNSWGIRNYEILPANSFDIALPILGVIPSRNPYSPMNP